MNEASPPSFKVVRFSFSPEFVAPVNVALLLFDGGKTRIIHDKKFEMLDVSVEEFRAHLAFWLDVLSEEIGGMSLEEASLHILSQSGQVVLGEPGKLLVDATPETCELLLGAFTKRRGNGR